MAGFRAIRLITTRVCRPWHAHLLQGNVFVGASASSLEQANLAVGISEAAESEPAYDQVRLSFNMGKWATSLYLRERLHLPLALACKHVCHEHPSPVASCGHVAHRREHPASSRVCRCHCWLQWTPPTTSLCNGLLAGKQLFFKGPNMRKELDGLGVVSLQELKVP